MKKFFFSLLVAMAAGCGILAGPRIRDFKASSSYCPFEPCQVIFSWQVVGLNNEERVMLRLPDGSAVPVDPVGSYEVIVGADLLTDLRIMRGSKEQERKDVSVDFHDTYEIAPKMKGELSRWHFRWPRENNNWSFGAIVAPEHMDGYAGRGSGDRLKDGSWFYFQLVDANLASFVFTPSEWGAFVFLRQVIFHEIAHGMDAATGWSHNGFKNEGCLYGEYFCNPTEGFAETYSILVLKRCIEAGISVWDLIYLVDWPEGGGKQLDKSCIPTFKEATPDLVPQMKAYLESLYAQGGNGGLSSTSMQALYERFGKY